MRARLLVVLAAGAVLLLTPGVAVARAQAVTFGVAYDEFVQGFGREHPRTVSFAGDGTADLDHLVWSHWGSAHPTAVGKGTFLWPGLSVASGRTRATVHVRLYRIRECAGVRAYTRMITWAPDYGERPHTSNALTLCSDVVHTKPFHEAKCAVGTTADGLRATRVRAYRMNCAGALAIIASATVAPELTGDPARFRAAGWYCGTDSGDSTSALLQCGLDDEQVSFIAHGTG